MEVLHEPPKANTFVPLAEHQSVTPESFYSGPTVLHYYSDRSKLIVLERDLQHAPALRSLVEKAPASLPTSENQTNGHTIDHSSDVTVEDVDVWVTSDKLFLYSNTASLGVAIPYPSISLHAIQSLPAPSVGEQQGLYMQLVPSNADSSDEESEPDSVSVTIIPTASAPPISSTEEEFAEDQPEQTPVVAMFTALSNCSNLHPDPVDSDDEGQESSRLFQTGLAIPGNTDGGLPPPMPGSGGWITAENMHEFVDEDGHLIADQEDDQDDEDLGPGAGTIRHREDDNQDADGENEETKWRRTS